LLKHQQKEASNIKVYIEQSEEWEERKREKSLDID